MAIIQTCHFRTSSDETGMVSYLYVGQPSDRVKVFNAMVNGLGMHLDGGKTLVSSFLNVKDVQQAEEHQRFEHPEKYIEAVATILNMAEDEKDFTALDKMIDRLVSSFPLAR